MAISQCVDFCSSSFKARRSTAVLVPLGSTVKFLKAHHLLLVSKPPTPNNKYLQYGTVV